MSMFVEERVRLCGVEEVAEGGMLRLEPVGMDPILLCRLEDGFHAVDDECTHAIASLSEGRLEGKTIFCPLHGGSFDVCTGKARSLPCKQALRTYPLEVADGTIWLLPGKKR